MNDEAYKGVLSVHKSNSVKKWHKKWAVLYRGSSQGVKRLEIFESKEVAEKKSSKKNIINLENCSSVKPEVNEGKKNEYLLRMDFTEGRQKQQVFLLENSQDRDTWLDQLSSTVFGPADMNGLDLFDVEIIQNEPAEKQHLFGLYQLAISPEDIILQKNGGDVIVWPLHLLRKYGRDKQEFSLEAGRRCPSGAGLSYFKQVPLCNFSKESIEGAFSRRFCFKSDQYNAIFQRVEENVKSLALRGRAASTSSNTSLGHRKKNDSMRPASPRTPIPTSSVYDDPIDLYKPAKSDVDDTYSEPIGLSLPPPKGKPKKQPKPHDISGPKKPPRKNGSDVNDTSEYSQLDLPRINVKDSEYDSINYNDSWNQQVDDENAYEVTDSHLERKNGCSTTEDSVYDHVKR